MLSWRQVARALLDTWSFLGLQKKVQSWIHEGAPPRTLTAVGLTEDAMTEQARPDTAVVETAAVRQVRSTGMVHGVEHFVEMFQTYIHVTYQQLQTRLGDLFLVHATETLVSVLITVNSLPHKVLYAD